MRTQLHVTPTEVGEYKLNCAELCGLTHWNMVATVRVVPEAEYTAWMEQKIAEQNIEVVSR
jgi:cytochrome c oxidase subunit 2